MTQNTLDFKRQDCDILDHTSLIQVPDFTVIWKTAIAYRYTANS